MNDTQHFKAARALAERTLAEGGATARTHRVLYRLRALAPPGRRRLPADCHALRRQRNFTRLTRRPRGKSSRLASRNPRGIAADDETAAWTMIANLILNLGRNVEPELTVDYYSHIDR